MAIQTQLRRGTTAENDAFTGAIGELVYDTQKKQLRMQDGTTLGGIKVPLIGDFESTGITDDATATVLTLTPTNNAEFSGDVSLVDNKHLYLGAGNDLDLYHDGTHSYIENNVGNVFIRQQTNGGLTSLQSEDSGGVRKNCITYGNATPNVSLYYDGLEVMSTVSNGINLVDDKHLYVGAGNDLDIYHDATISRIDNNTGSLFISELVDSGEIRLRTRNSVGVLKECIIAGGATTVVKLHYDGVEVFKTRAAGVEVLTFSSVGASVGIVLSNYQIAHSINVTGSNNHVEFYNPNGLVGSINVNGTTTAYNTSSDKRLKTSHGLVEDAANILNQIEIHEYHFNNDNSLTLHGVMAQDCIDVYPNAISHDEENDTWGADYSKLVPIMLANIQELNRQVQTLQGAH